MNSRAEKVWLTAVHRLQGSWRMPNEEKERAADELRISGCRRQASSSLVPQLFVVFSEKLEQSSHWSHGWIYIGKFYIYLFSNFGCFSWCVAALFRVVHKASVRAEVVQGDHATREEIGNAFTCLVLLRNPSGIHHPKDIRFFETNQVQCIHMNLVHKVSLDTWRNTSTFGQSFPFTLKP